MTEVRVATPQDIRCASCTSLDIICDGEMAKCHCSYHGIDCNPRWTCDYHAWYRKVEDE